MTQKQGKSTPAERGPDGAPGRRSTAAADGARTYLQATRHVALLALCLLGMWHVAGCRSVQDYRLEADTVAYEIIEQKQQEALGRAEPMNVESPADTLRRRLLLDQNLPHSGAASLGVHDLPPNEYWDAQKHLAKTEGSEVPWGGPEPLRLTLLDALEVAARNSREYQAAKEDVFLAALDLDLERDEFRNTFSGLLSGLISTDRSGEEVVSGTVGSAEASVSRKLKSGVELSGLIALDLAKLLTQDRSSSLGLFADASISIPLLRGSGRLVNEEPLTQAERNVVYAIYEFERFKKTFAVQVASNYLSVLRELQQVTNAEENYKSLVRSARRARRLADAGQIPELQFDQAVQEELSARDRWIAARQSYASGLDQFKVLLALPPDAGVGLEPDEMDRLRAALGGLTEGSPVTDYSGKVPPADSPVVLREPSREQAGALELEPEIAVELALDNRLDLRAAEGSVHDAQRKVFVAADSLRTELTLLGTARAGARRDVASAGSDNARLDPDDGTYSVLLSLDLPLERTAERNEYRKSLVSLEQAVRGLQELEDQVKLSVRDKLRDLLEARESLQVQSQALTVAQKRVRSTDLLIQAGRAEMRDLLEAQAALLSAQNSVTSAAVNYRVAELELERDMGVLQVDENGLWQEYSHKGE